ncbi:hypothetical protein FFLO_06717 [Filobasidium floriforme]|uniref:Uncharacterized protein n=1 Tax=Filobasidium floriforme TaxID=5210 RepID=A0A8K0JGR5_9TREE|nr:uncharacterized protein HD553DRAFT_327274 [Filobasidium floriforme]KAG7527655.1 hypothetical protein FFLO_06717 [Filobasidium floriforme]KAH8077452.1 hypothetical protein HD553DRAFT_327274 [Filobasidium floriforme]
MSSGILPTSRPRLRSGGDPFELIAGDPSIAYCFRAIGISSKLVQRTILRGGVGKISRLNLEQKSSCPRSPALVVCFDPLRPAGRPTETNLQTSSYSIKTLTSIVHQIIRYCIVKLLAPGPPFLPGDLQSVAANRRLEVVREEVRLPPWARAISQDHRYYSPLSTIKPWRWISGHLRPCRRAKPIKKNRKLANGPDLRSSDAERRLILDLRPRKHSAELCSIAGP